MTLDSVLADALDIARDAAIEAAGDESAVGAYLGAVALEENVVSHQFECLLPGYHGWVWTATLSRLEDSEATVCEACLLPADGALLAPAWIPWVDRIRPGDLEPSMVLPFMSEDVRLDPGYQATGDEVEDKLAIEEFGLGRERVLNPLGRQQAEQRWLLGANGPSSPTARTVAPCSSCGFYIPLTGGFRQYFGACANEWSPADGNVVSSEHTCGAHSQTDAERAPTQWPNPNPIFDTDSVQSLQSVPDVIEKSVAHEAPLEQESPELEVVEAVVEGEVVTEVGEALEAVDLSEASELDAARESAEANGRTEVEIVLASEVDQAHLELPDLTQIGLEKEAEADTFADQN